MNPERGPHEPRRAPRLRRCRERRRRAPKQVLAGPEGVCSGLKGARVCNGAMVWAQTRGVGEPGEQAHKGVDRPLAGSAWAEVRRGGRSSNPPASLARLAVIPVEGGDRRCERGDDSGKTKRGCLSPLERRDCVIEEGVIAVVPPSPVARAMPWTRLAFERWGRTNCRQWRIVPPRLCLCERKGGSNAMVHPPPLIAPTSPCVSRGGHG